MEKKNTTRREFIANAGKAGIALSLASTVLPAFAALHDNGTIDPSFIQQPLPYAYKDLDAAIDAMTMEIHYTKHAAAYQKNLVEACVVEKVDTNQKLSSLLGNVSKYSAKMRNNAGGHYNHELFWQSMAAHSTGKPSGKLLDAITRDFGSFDAFKTQFTDAGKNRFGSGWAWLIINKDGKLAIGSTSNQDNPLMDVSDLKGFPVLGLDVWEHAYYLRYQNKRPDYITTWWNVVNWDFIEKRYTSAI
jgi:Fe-Mn family superoxide dismutase